MGNTSLPDLSWLQGIWFGYDENNTIEEHWGLPRGEALMGMFRMLKGNEPIFYEFMTIGVEEGDILLRIKHFYPRLVGWEEKDECVIYSLEKLTPGEARFVKRSPDETDRLVYQRDNDVLNVFFESEQGAASGYRFVFRLEVD